MDLFFKRLSDKIETVVESLNEAVNIRDISPEARSEVLKQKEMHRKTNVKKDKDLSPELHSMSPMKKAEKEALDKKVAEDLKKDDEVLYYHADPSKVTAAISLPTNASTRTNDATLTDKNNGEATLTDGPKKEGTVRNVDPDTIYHASKTKKDVVTFVYYPQTQELFYMDVAGKDNNDPYNLSNYLISEDNKNNPLNELLKTLPKDEFDRIRWNGDLQDGPGTRTHIGLLDILRIVFKFPELRDQYKVTDTDIAYSKKYVTSINDKFIIGRSGTLNEQKIISFWNKLKPEIAKNIASTLEKKTGDKFSKIYVADRNIHRS